MSAVWECVRCGQYPLRNDELADHLELHKTPLTFNSFRLHSSGKERKRPLPADTGEGPSYEQDRLF